MSKKLVVHLYDETLPENANKKDISFNAQRELVISKTSWAQLEENAKRDGMKITDLLATVYPLL